LHQLFLVVFFFNFFTPLKGRNVSPAQFPAHLLPAIFFSSCSFVILSRFRSRSFRNPQPLQPPICALHRTMATVPWRLLLDSVPGYRNRPTLHGSCGRCFFFFYSHAILVPLGGLVGCPPTHTRPGLSTFFLPTTCSMVLTYFLPGYSPMTPFRIFLFRLTLLAFLMSA